MEELAQREAVSANFLVQILNDLRRAGLVASRRGQGGGYLLARAPQNITLRQVVEAVDPALLQCSVSAAGESGFAVRQAWEQVSNAVCRELDQVTVVNLVSEPGAAMFYI